MRDWVHAVLAGLPLVAVLVWAFRRAAPRSRVVMPASPTRSAGTWEPVGLGQSEPLKTPPAVAISACSLDVFCFSSHPEVVDSARHCVSAFGVGSCGPRGFYGTTSEHSQLERDAAVHFNMPAATLYSSALTGLSSLMSAFAKKGDTIVTSTAASESLLHAVRLSRATHICYTDGDMEDLSAVLSTLAYADRIGKRRRFLLFEGGDDSRAVIELGQRWGFRIVLEDTLNFGLGPYGRGTLAAAGLRAEDVDFVVCGLGRLGSAGGLVFSSKELAVFQELTSLAYCFSASAPTFLCSSARASLALLKGEKWLAPLREKLEHICKAFEEGCPSVTVVTSSAVSRVHTGDAMALSVHCLAHGLQGVVECMTVYSLRWTVRHSVADARWAASIVSMF